MMNVADFEEEVSALPDDLKPDIVLLHRNVDLETYKAEKGEDTSEMTEWGNIKSIKKLIGDGLVAVAGGITPNKVEGYFKRCKILLLQVDTLLVLEM